MTIEEQVTRMKQEIIDSLTEIPASMGLEVTCENILAALRSDYHQLSVKAHQVSRTPQREGDYDQLAVSIKALRELIAEYEQRAERVANGSDADYLAATYTTAF